MEPHAPYAPKPESLKLFDRGFEGQLDGSQKSINRAGRIRPKVSAEDVEHLLDLYDAEIYDADQGFADFLELLQKAGRLDNALIVFVADHGEGFNEHRTLGHGNTLNQEGMHVPLIIRYPDGEFAGIRVSERVSSIDVLPTLLAVLGIDPPMKYPLSGRNITPAALDSSPCPEAPIYAEVARYDGDDLVLASVIDEDGYKRVLNTSRLRGMWPFRGVRPLWGMRATKESIGLWNTQEDVGEQLDLRSTNPVRAAYHEQLIARWLQEQRHWRDVLVREPAPPVELTDEMRKELRELGYLE
ncbi:MAG: sulfatase-like hydrolase/transferase, partial [Armatimonadetes bacterium]|nr:sulfatase-like hydrolase/transferase [Armatimonadota bacterium]